MSMHGAEFLIYDQAHWMDKLTSEDVTAYCEKYPNFQVKYDTRYQRGDVVEVRPDGFWTGQKARGFNQDAFRVVVVGGLSEKDAKHYIESTETKKRRYSISTGSGTKIQIESSINDLNITDKDLISETNKSKYIAGGLLSIIFVSLLLRRDRKLVC